MSKEELNQYDPTKDEDTIIWIKNRKLTWEDFMGIPDDTSKHIALTNSAMYQKADPVVKKTSGGYVFTLGNIKTFTLFRKSGSWVKKELLTGTKRDLILEHEQGHFDIHEIFRRKFEEVLQSESRKIRSCEGKNLKDAEFNADKKIEKILRNIGRVILTKRNQYNQKYEDETNHGDEVEIQKKYTQEIQELLRKGNIPTNE